MTCPHLEYRAESGDQRFDVERAYCTVVDEFVQPMRADICNDRHDLDHEAHCEIYREHEGLDGDDVTATDGGSDAASEEGTGQ